MKKCSPKKTLLGVIGGMGPLADTVFLHRLHSLTVAKSDRDYIPVIYDGNCKRPDRSDFLTGKSNKSPKESLKASLKKLEREGADVIVMPCNTAHYWLSRIKRHKRRNTLVIDMIYETCLECHRADLKTICLLATEGTYAKDLYGDYLFKLGIDCIYPSKGLKTQISSLIKSLKNGKRLSLTEIEGELSKLSCDGFILGCTELSLANEYTDSPKLKYIDCLTALSSKVIKVFGKASNGSTGASS